SKGATYPHPFEPALRRRPTGRRGKAGRRNHAQVRRRCGPLRPFASFNGVLETTTAKPPADGARGSYPDTSFDAILLVAFGGPEGMDDVMPFLENVTRGRNVPPERLDEVAHHYACFGGLSPINAQNRALIAALRPELDAHGIDLPVYLGNRNWHPLLADTLRGMRAD